MVSSNLWTNIDAMLSDIISPSTDLSFTGLSVMVIGDYLQLSPVKMRFIFSRFTSRNKVNQLLSLQLRHLLKYAERTELLRQHDEIFLMQGQTLHTYAENKSTFSII